MMIVVLRRTGLKNQIELQIILLLIHVRCLFQIKNNRAMRKNVGTMKDMDVMDNIEKNILRI